MKMKFKITRRLAALATLAAAFVAALSAQNTTTPYSMYGYGILGDRATSMQRQMGSVGYAMPVSYTKLRAHDTTHDLVCRLLH